MRGDTLSLVVSRGPSDTDTSHRYHHFIQPVYSYSEDPGGEKSREHVCEVEYAGAPLSERSKSFSKRILCQITSISECNETDRQCNKARTITKSHLTFR